MPARKGLHFLAPRRARSSPPNGRDQGEGARTVSLPSYRGVVLPMAGGVSRVRKEKRGSRRKPSETGVDEQPARFYSFFFSLDLLEAPRSLSSVHAHAPRGEGD